MDLKGLSDALIGCSRQKARQLDYLKSDSRVWYDQIQDFPAKASTVLKIF